MSQLKRQSGFRRSSSKTWSEACCAVTTAAASSSCGGPLNLLQVEIINANPMTFHRRGHSSFFIPAPHFFSHLVWVPKIEHLFACLAYLMLLIKTYFLLSKIWMIYIFKNKSSCPCSRLQLTCKPDGKSSVLLINLTRALLQLVSVSGLGLLTFFPFSFSSL